MPESSDQEKTEPATPKKREEARRKGQIAKSRELPSVLILLSALFLLFFTSSWMIFQLSDIMHLIFEDSLTMPFTIESLSSFAWMIFWQTMRIIFPFMVIILVAGILGNLFQVGFLLTTETMTPKLSKLNPISGIKKLFSVRSLVELAKSMFKMAIVGTIAYIMVKKEAEKVPGLIELSVGEILSFIGHTAFNITLYTAFILIILSALDYFFQKWQHEKDLKMTKQEVKDEYKQREGDPQVKSRIRSVQREMAQKRMMESVPEATVVVTNPTHIAVALKFEDGFHAPVIIAKGTGFIAEKIKMLAKEHHIPIVEQKPLAQILYKTVGIGEFIPADLYRAVAEVLAYVYRLKGMSHAE